MIVETALRLAGDQARLVSRPTGRLHVYAGPLTPSGRFVPRSARTVCRAHTRRLEVVRSLPGSSLDLDAHPERVLCTRCSARLLQPGRAEQLSTRSEFLGQYCDMSKADLAVGLAMANTQAEVDAAAHLTLVLFDVAGTLTPFTEHGRTWPPLHQLVHDARDRVHGFPEALYTAQERGAAIDAATREKAIARRREIHADNEARIARLGITNAKPARRASRGA